MDFEKEWYEGVRIGLSYNCDRDKTSILNRDEFMNLTKNNNHYCEGCWNYMALRKGNCPTCNSSFSLRSVNEKVFKLCCGNTIRLE